METPNSILKDLHESIEVNSILKKIPSKDLTVKNLLSEHRARVELVSLERLVSSDPEVIKFVENKRSVILTSSLAPNLIQLSDDNLLESAFELSNQLHNKIIPELKNYEHLGRFGQQTYIIGDNEVTNPFPDQVKEVMQEASPNINFQNSAAISQISNHVSNISQAVCCIVKEPDWYSHHNQDQYILNTLPYGERYNLGIDTEAFYHEPCLAYGSATGFLVAPNLVVTAEHVILGKTDEELKSLRFIFDYKLEDATHVMNIEVSEKQVYKFKQVVNSGSRSHNDETDFRDDWCILELDLTVAGVNPLELSNPELVVDTPLAMIGHPRGLPQKASMKGEITAIEDDHLYQCNLDSFSGNSGSPVLDLNTLKIVGIFTRGRKDFERNEDRDRVNAYIDDDQAMYAQKFISIQPVIDYLPL